MFKQIESFIKTWIRPMLTVYFALLFGYIVIHPALFDGQQLEVLNVLLWINLLTLGFWFGERAIKNLKDNGVGFLKEKK